MVAVAFQSPVQAGDTNQSGDARNARKTCTVTTVTTVTNNRDIQRARARAGKSFKTTNVTGDVVTNAMWDSAKGAALNES